MAACIMVQPVLQVVIAIPPIKIRIASGTIPLPTGHTERTYINGCRQQTATDDIHLVRELGFGTTIDLGSQVIKLIGNLCIPSFIPVNLFGQATPQLGKLL
ncbi:hypothetical protein D3C77_664900 [compost metagenome]